MLILRQVLNSIWSRFEGQNRKIGRLCHKPAFLNMWGDAPVWLRPHWPQLLSINAVGGRNVHSPNEFPPCIRVILLNHHALNRIVLKSSYYLTISETPDFISD